MLKLIRVDLLKTNTQRCYLQFVLAAEVSLSQRVVEVHLLTGEGHGHLRQYNKHIRIELMLKV